MYISRPADSTSASNPQDELARARKYLSLAEKLLWISHSVGDNKTDETIVQGSRAFTEVNALSQLFQAEDHLQ